MHEEKVKKSMGEERERKEKLRNEPTTVFYMIVLYNDILCTHVHYYCSVFGGSIAG